MYVIFVYAGCLHNVYVSIDNCMCLSVCVYTNTPGNVLLNAKPHLVFVIMKHNVYAYVLYMYI